MRQLEESSTTEGSSDDGDERTPVALTELAAVPAPTALTPHPGTGDLYVAERTGRVHRVDRESGDVAADPVVDIADEVAADGERGLLGLAFSEDGGHLYLSYSNLDGDTRVHEWEFADGAVVDDSRREVLALAQPYPNHNGGEIKTGPDGNLYVGLGDGGAPAYPEGTARTPAPSSAASCGSTRWVGTRTPSPTGTPSSTRAVRRRSGRTASRNPWRFSFDQDTGDLWIGDVGQDAVEEVDLLPAEDGGGAGANLEWNVKEGARDFADGSLGDDRGSGPCTSTTATAGTARSPAAYVYRGSAIPWLDGAYVFSDFCAGDLRFLRPDGSELVPSEPLGVGLGTNTLASFGQDLEGEIYVLSMGDGLVFRLDPA
ncbi:MAG: PQQ-dependent sugar dehydrogenase [Acidimicrobiia bacterium]|nr:PQQ-dependent sugar dehydrogenase [Acidimicrobiia bacterium]